MTHSSPEPRDGASGCALAWVTTASKTCAMFQVCTDGGVRSPLPMAARVQGREALSLGRSGLGRQHRLVGQTGILEASRILFFSCLELV